MEKMKKITVGIVIICVMIAFFFYAQQVVSHAQKMSFNLKKIEVVNDDTLTASLNNIRKGDTIIREAEDKKDNVVYIPTTTSTNPTEQTVSIISSTLYTQLGFLGIVLFILGALSWKYIKSKDSTEKELKDAVMKQHEGFIKVREELFNVCKQQIEANMKMSESIDKFTDAIDNVNKTQMELSLVVKERLNKL